MYNLCFPTDTYTFEIIDSASDGLCCLYGNGMYQILVNNVIVASGGEYGAQETKTFSVAPLPPTSPTPTPPDTPAPPVPPTPAPPPPCPGTSITVELTTDVYYVETSWRITSGSENGPVIVQRPSYNSQGTFVNN